MSVKYIMDALRKKHGRMRGRETLEGEELTGEIAAVSEKGEVKTDVPFFKHQMSLFDWMYYFEKLSNAEGMGINDEHGLINNYRIRYYDKGISPEDAVVSEIEVREAEWIREEGNE